MSNTHNHQAIPLGTPDPGHCLCPQSSLVEVDGTFNHLPRLGWGGNDAFGNAVITSKFGITIIVTLGWDTFQGVLDSTRQHSGRQCAVTDQLLINIKVKVVTPWISGSILWLIANNRPHVPTGSNPVHIDLI